MWREEGQDDRFLCDARYTLLEKNKVVGKIEEGIIRVFVLFFFLQEWPYSHGILALQAGRKTEPTTDVGAGTSHPEGSHLQG